MLEALEVRETKEARLRREADSLLHRVAHLPKIPYCRICNETNCKAAQARRRDPQVPRFGDLVLGDHLVMASDRHKGASGESAGLILKDQGPGWRDVQAISISAPTC